MLTRTRAAAALMITLVVWGGLGAPALAQPLGGGDADVRCSRRTCELAVQVPARPASRPPVRAARPEAPAEAPTLTVEDIRRIACPPGQACVNPVGPAGGPGAPVGFAVGGGLPAPPPAPGGGGAAPAPVDPAVLAELAISELEIAPPPIRMSPPPGSEGATVGFPMWMWLDPGPQATGPVTATAAAGGVAVTATARLQQVQWAMGDGVTVTCAGPGTPFTADRAGQPSPDCGHLYTRRSPAVTVTATAVWQVAWAGGGESGTAQLTADAAADLPVREIRTLNTSAFGGG